MLEARGDRDLAQEALGTKLRGQLGAEDLDRDGPTGHPAPAEFSVDCVSRSERSLQLVELVSHVVPSAYTRNATVQQLRQARQDSRAGSHSLSSTPAAPRPDSRTGSAPCCCCSHSLA